MDKRLREAAKRVLQELAKHNESCTGGLLARL